MEIKRLHGSTDSPLSESGLREARQTAKALVGLGIEQIYCSPLGRALQTATIIGNELGLTPIPVEQLREMDFGVYEGRRNGPLNTSNRILRMILFGFLKTFGGKKYGENYVDFQRRIASGWKMIQEQNHAQKIAIVSHSGTLWNLIYQILNTYHHQIEQHNSLAPCSITEFEINEPSATMKILQFNNVAHLVNQSASQSL